MFWSESVFRQCYCSPASGGSWVFTMAESTTQSTSAPPPPLLVSAPPPPLLLPLHFTAAPRGPPEVVKTISSFTPLECFPPSFLQEVCPPPLPLLTQAPLLLPLAPGRRLRRSRRHSCPCSHLARCGPPWFGSAAPGVVVAWPPVVAVRPPRPPSGHWRPGSQAVEAGGRGRSGGRVRGPAWPLHCLLYLRKAGLSAGTAAVCWAWGRGRDSWGVRGGMGSNGEAALYRYVPRGGGGGLPPTAPSSHWSHSVV